MGNCESIEQSPSSTFFPSVLILNHRLPSQFGEVKLVKEKLTGREMYLKEIVVNTKQAFDTQLAYYNTRVSSPHRNLINVIGYTTEKNVTLCAEHYKINLYLDSLSTTMEDQLYKCIKKGEFISEVQLQLIAEHLITILSDFQRKNIVHGNICPSSIYVTEEAYKICDPSFEGQMGANGVSRVILLGQKPLLAPELLSKIPAQDLEIKTDKYKADVYSLGATLLSLATLERSEDLYNYQKGTIDLKTLEARLYQVESMYSPLFSDLLKELLTHSESKRPDFVQLHNKLNIGELVKSYSNTKKMDSHGNVPYVKAMNNIIKSPEGTRNKSIFSDEHGVKKDSLSRSSGQYVTANNPSISQDFVKQSSINNRYSYLDNYPLAQSNYIPTDNYIHDASRPQF